MVDIDLSSGSNSLRSGSNGTWRPVREAGNCCHHHAGKQLHGGDILMIEGIGCGGEHFEDSQCILKLAQRRSQDRAHAQAMAAQPVNMRTSLGVIAEDNLAGAQAFSGNSRSQSGGGRLDPARCAQRGHGK